jgi:hypothetical protein
MGQSVVRPVRQNAATGTGAMTEHSSRGETRRWGAGAPLALVLVCVACAVTFRIRADRSARAASTPVRSPASVEASVLPYPHGRWRLATWDELDSSAIWISHIVVAHAQSHFSSEFRLRPLTWAPDPRPPDRTPEAALSRALDVASRASEDPASFPRLAREYSDDVVTRDEGGSLGGRRATQLPPAYLDAVEALRVGEVSRPIATPLGFVVLMRRAPPAEELVAGRRVVTRYRGTIGGPAGAPSDRTRDEALAIARSLAGRAKGAAVGAFADLVARSSESADVVRGGDLGVWSLRDPGFLPREVEALGELEVGGVTDPIDSVYGFEVLQRTPVEPRPRLAMSSVQLGFDPAAPDGDEHSRSRVAVEARSLAQQLAADPSSMPKLEGEHCCLRPESWTRGRGLVNVESTLERLAIGAISRDPIESGSAYVIPKRLDPSTVPEAPPAKVELPAPIAPDLDAVVRNADGAALAVRVRSLSKAAAAELRFDAAASGGLIGTFEELAATFEREPGPAAGPDRVNAMHEAFARLEAALGPERYRALRDFLDRSVTAELLSEPR